MDIRASFKKAFLNIVSRLYLNLNEPMLPMYTIQISYHGPQDILYHLVAGRSVSTMAVHKSGFVIIGPRHNDVACHKTHRRYPDFQERLLVTSKGTLEASNRIFSNERGGKEESVRENILSILWKASGLSYIDFFKSNGTPDNEKVSRNLYVLIRAYEKMLFTGGRRFLHPQSRQQQKVLG